MANDRQLGSERRIINALNGTSTYVGSIVSSGASTTNATTATPFTLEAGGTYKIQAASQFYFKTGVAANGTVAVGSSGSDSELVDTNEKAIFILQSTEDTIAVMPVTGTVTVKVFRMN